jgi:hypothetical protein
MDEWDSSVWATPTTPSNISASLKAKDEKSASSESLPSPGQTISFSVDDAFDDKSAPTTPGFFSAIKLPVPNVDVGGTLDVNGPSIPGDDGFGDFDDFAATSMSGQALDDDFGDFGDFGDDGGGGEFGTVISNGFGGGAQDGFENNVYGTEALEAPARWQPLPVDPLPPPKELSELVGELLGPVWPNLRPNEFMSDEPERQVEGVAQILVTPERYV